MKHPLYYIPALSKPGRIFVSTCVGLGVMTILSLTYTASNYVARADGAANGAGMPGTSPGASRTAGNTQPSQGSNTGGTRTGDGPKPAASTPGATAPTARVSANTAAPAVSKNSAPAAAAPAAPSPTANGGYRYPLHNNIKTTYFWAGEEASADNDFIQNISSAWMTDWKSAFGGTDDPFSRCGYNPCAFTPRENPFYFALPFGDYTESGPVADLSMVHWYAGPVPNGQSILKNRWIQINALNKTVYAQWEDVGPFNWNDSSYVFGTSAPASTRAGLDVSPAVRDYLGMGGSTTSSWRFVDYSEVPSGPWKNTITTSSPNWN